MGKDVLPSDVAHVAARLFGSLETPLAKLQLKRLKEGDWNGISDVSLDPRQYTEALPYLLDAAVGSFLKKFKDLPSTHDKRANAVSKWWDGERSCFASNERLSPYLPENSLFTSEVGSPKEDHVMEFFHDVRQTIQRWIGPAPPKLLQGRFGPGATFSVKGRRISVPDKMLSQPTLTHDALYFLPQWVGTQWGAYSAQRHGEVSFVPGNRFATVPKTARTDRAIAAEPDINVFYQLGLGSILRRRLKDRAGWNMDLAQDIHGRVARESSVSKEFATLDLSNASDTVSRNLVKILLPHLWYEQLDMLRSKKTLIDGKWVVLEKFSSMGNGFTFELETIIFAAISSVVHTRVFGYEGSLGVDFFTFGDDIIVKEAMFRPLTAVLRFCGFSLNREKTFSGDDPFRESCGHDYFQGSPVRPYFLKESVNGPQNLISIANGLSALMENVTACGGVLPRSAWFACLDRIPSGIRRCRGPKALGDVVIHDSQENWNFRWRSGIRYLECFRPARWRRVSLYAFSDPVILACATYGVGSPNRKGWSWAIDGGLIPRDGVLSYKVGRVPFS